MAQVKVDFKSDTSSVTQGVAKVHSSIDRLKSSASSLGSKFETALTSLAGGMALLGGAIFAGTSDLLNYAGGLSELSTTLGIGADKIAIFKEAFRQSGVEGEKLGMILTKMSAAIREPDIGMLNWFKSLNISIRDIQKMPIDEQFELIGKKIAELNTPAQRISATMEIFGKKVGATLLPLFRTKDALSDAKIMLGGLAEAMKKNAPALDDIGDIFTGIGAKTKQFFAGALNEQNLAKLKSTADYIKTLDLTMAGKSAGIGVNIGTDIVKNLSSALKDGTIWKTLISGFKMVADIWIGILSSGLIEVMRSMSYMADKIFNTITDKIFNNPLFKIINGDLNKNAPETHKIQAKLAGTKTDKWLGEMLGNSGLPFFEDYGIEQTRIADAIIEELNAELKLVSKSTEATDSFSKTFNDIADKLQTEVLSKWEEDYNEFMESLNNSIKKESMTPGAGLLTPNTTIGKAKAGAELSPYKPGLEPQVWKSTAPNIDEVVQAEYRTEAYKPITTTLGAMGGDAANMRINDYTANPLVSLQSKANAYLQAIVENTKQKQPAPSWAAED